MNLLPWRTRLRRWAQLWWLHVPHPRELSIAFGVVYFFAFATGFVTAIMPPNSLSLAVGGATLMRFVGIILMAGALCGMVGGYFEWWDLERSGIIGMSGALVIYGGVVLGLHFVTEGSRLSQFGLICIALTPFAIRWIMIRVFAFRPGK